MICDTIPNMITHALNKEKSGSNSSGISENDYKADNHKHVVILEDENSTKFNQGIKF